MSSGVAAAISAAAGPGLSEELEQNFPMGIKEGDIAATQGHDLQCNEVYNGYLSPWYSRRSTGAQPPDLVCMKSCYDLYRGNMMENSDNEFQSNF